MHSTDDSDLTPDQHEFQYNPQRAFPDFAQHAVRREPLNQAANRHPGRRIDIAYGDGALRTLDFYPAPGAGRAPAHLFIHGGYWRQQDKRAYGWLGARLASQGLSTLVINYALCPAVTLDGVVESAQAAFAWVCRHLDELGAHPRRLSLSGHSAGAHLVAGILSTDWRGHGIDAGIVTGATLISGIYDPRPAIRTSVNADLRLDLQMARRHDVEARPPTVQCPVTLLVGGREPERWIDQTFRYSRQLRRHGGDPGVHVVPARGHFDIIDDYLVDGSDLHRAIEQHARR